MAPGGPRRAQECQVEPSAPSVEEQPLVEKVPPQLGHPAGGRREVAEAAALEHVRDPISGIDGVICQRALAEVRTRSRAERLVGEEDVFTELLAFARGEPVAETSHP